RVVRGRAVALRRLPIRLAALHSVALPLARARLRPPGDSAVAQPRAGRHLRVRHPGGVAGAAVEVLRTAQPAVAGRACGAQRAALAITAGGAAPDLPRGRGGGAVRPPGVRAVPGGLGRDALGDGVGEPVLRAGRVRPRRGGDEARAPTARRLRLETPPPLGGVARPQPLQRPGVLRLRQSRTYGVGRAAIAPARPFSYPAVDPAVPSHRREPAKAARRKGIR